jgi:hypothetical protein
MRESQSHRFITARCFVRPRLLMRCDVLDCLFGSAARPGLHAARGRHQHGLLALALALHVAPKVVRSVRANACKGSAIP